MSASYFVVVLLLKGRNFPKRPNCFLVAEAKFNGNVVTSDPVEHSDCPQFTQELAWNIDKRTLQQLRLQTSILKVQFYCQNGSGSSRDLIGHVIFDLKSAGESFKENIKWCPVHHTKYTKSKPEVQMNLYIDTQHPVSDSLSQTSNSETMKSHKMLDSSIKPILNPVSGIYNIGGDDSNKPMFVFTVAIALASNLVQLTPSDSTLDTRYGYFFYFSLLDSDTTTQKFNDIISPKFETERFSVKISSSLENLKHYFEYWSALEIHFCCYNKVLGSCNIPIVNLVTSDINKRPASIEGIFQLIPPKSSNSKKMKLIPDEMRPCIGASVTLKMMSQDIQGDVQQVNGRENVSPDILIPAAKGILKKKLEDLPPYNVQNIEYLPEGSKKNQNIIQHMQLKKSPLIPINCGQLQSTTDAIGALNGNKNTNSMVDETPAGNGFLDVFHEFNVSVDLRNIMLLHIQKPLFVYLRYLYQFFGTSEPIVTETFEIMANSEVAVPKSLCSFDFATDQKRFEDSLQRVPLIVEVWASNTKASKGSCIGIVEVDLSRILQSSDIGDAKVKQWTGRLHITSSLDDKSHNIGFLGVHMELLDVGPVNVGQATATKTYQHQTIIENHAKVPPPNFDMRESSEYKAALELELWKQQQMEEHRTELSKIRKEQEKVWENEFKKMDDEKILLMSAEKEKYETLKEKLKTNLADIEKREKLLHIRENELERKRQEMKREHDRTLQELQEASKKMQDDFNHQVKMERKKLEAAEDTISNLKKQLSYEEQRYQKVVKELDICRGKMRPEMELVAKVNTLTHEKIKLEDELDSTKRKLDACRVDLSKMFIACQKLKRKEKRKMEEDIEKLKMEVALGGEKNALEMDRLELRDISSSLNRLGDIKVPSRLRTHHLSKKRHSNQKGNSVKDEEDYYMNDDDDDDEEEEEEEVVGGGLRDKNLAHEKNVLLKTGLYTESDSVIKSFDKILVENNF